MIKIFNNLFSGMPSPTRRKGFSLVETVVYIGMVIVILVALVNMLLSMSRAYGYLKYSRHLQSSATASVDRMARDIRNSVSIDVVQSTLDSNPGILTLNTTTEAGAAQTFQYYISSGVIHVKQDGVDLGPLTLPDVTVNSLIFRKIETGISQAVKIEMTLTAGTRTANFYDTAILRGSY
jgi:type II secretory pathway pseudopilin PulG